MDRPELVPREAQGANSNDELPDKPPVAAPAVTDAPSDDATGADPESVDNLQSGPPYTAFSTPTKRWIVTMAALASFVSPMTATMYFPAMVPLAAELRVPTSLINLTLTTYMVCQAIAPTLVGDLSDAAGRRPAFIIAFTIYIFANLGLALQGSYAALLVLRMLQSAGSSGTLSVCFAAVADVSVTAERGTYMGTISAAINIGPALSPVLGGILAEYLGWRAIFWFCLIYAAVWLIPYTLAVPESCRNVVGNGSVPARGWNRTILDFFRSRRQQHPPPADDTPDGTPKRKLRFPNPFNALRVVFEKDLAILLLYGALVYLVFILISATLSTELAEIYKFNNLQIGLCFLPYGLGCCCAALLQGYILDRNYRRVARRIGFTIDYKRGDDLRHFPIEEARIVPVYPILGTGIAAVIAYGWVLQAGTHPAGLLVMLFLVGLCVTGSFAILHTLVVDLYPEAPATAVAANNLVRCICGAAATAVIDYMLRAMGRGWTYTFWGLALLVCSPALWLLTVRGPKWREERRVRKLGEKGDGNGGVTGAVEGGN